MLELDTKERRAVIIDAAFNVFLSYGFRRTTMGDIADAAGISRPALYLEFKNKADIYRAGLVVFIEKTFRDVDVLLSESQPIVDRIKRALSVALVTPKRNIANTPHGAELFEIKEELAKDMGHDWNSRLAESLRLALEQAEADGEIRTPAGVRASDVARLIATSADGFKSKICDWDKVEADLHLLVDLILKPLVRQS